LDWNILAIYFDRRNKKNTILNFFGIFRKFLIFLESKEKKGSEMSEHEYDETDLLEGSGHEEEKSFEAHGRNFLDI